MRVRGFLLVVALLLVGVSVSALADDTGLTPNLVGTWNCVYLESDSQNLGYEANNSPIRTVYIEEQYGRIFEGYKDYVWTDGVNSRRMKEQFLGIIGDDDTSIYMNDYSSGMAFGELTSPDEITVYYMHALTATGKKDPAVAIARYIRG